MKNQQIERVGLLLFTVILTCLSLRTGVIQRHFSQFKWKIIKYENHVRNSFWSLFFQFPWSNLIFLASSFKFHLFLKFSKFIYIEFPRFIQSRAFDSFAVFFLTTFTYVKAHLFTQLTLIMIFIYGSIVIFF